MNMELSIPNTHTALLEFFRGLADVRRLQIAGRLAAGNCSVEQLAEQLGQSPREIRRQMFSLEHAGLVAGPDGPAVSANRVVISRGLDRQVVYYWFQQRGRMITNEYLVKWFILQDSILRYRTDGAMVRLVTALGRDEPEAAADARLLRFAHAIYPEHPRAIDLDRERGIRNMYPGGGGLVGEVYNVGYTRAMLQAAMTLGER